jgi:hypothetical protein
MSPMFSLFFAQHVFKYNKNASEYEYISELSWCCSLALLPPFPGRTHCRRNPFFPQLVNINSGQWHPQLFLLALLGFQNLPNN